MISLFISFLVIMFKFTFYLALFPFWLIWWFIKIVSFSWVGLKFVWEVSMLVEKLIGEEDGKIFSFLLRNRRVCECMLFLSKEMEENPRLNIKYK